VRSPRRAAMTDPPAGDGGALGEDPAAAGGLSTPRVEEWANVGGAAGGSGFLAPLMWLLVVSASAAALWRDAGPPRPGGGAARGACRSVSLGFWPEFGDERWRETRGWTETAAGPARRSPATVVSVPPPPPTTRGKAWPAALRRPNGRRGEPRRNVDESVPAVGLRAGVLDDVGPSPLRRPAAPAPRARPPRTTPRGGRPANDDLPLADPTGSPSLPCWTSFSSATSDLF